MAHLLQVQKSSSERQPHAKHHIGSATRAKMSKMWPPPPRTHKLTGGMIKAYRYQHRTTECGKHQERGTQCIRGAFKKRNIGPKKPSWER